METLDFETNWNGGKLNMDCFTTFRLHNPKKYVVGNSLIISLKGTPIKEVIIMQIKKVKLSEVNEFMAHIDTGYNREEFTKIVKKMYKNIENIENQDFDFMLLKTTRKTPTLFEKSE